MPINLKSLVNAATDFVYHEEKGEYKGMTIFEKRKRLAEARERMESIEQKNIEISQAADSSEETLLEAADVLISDSNRIAKAVTAIVKEEEFVEMDDGEKISAMSMIQENIDEIQEYIPRLREELGMKNHTKGLQLPKMADGRTMDLSDWFRFMDRDATKFRADILLLMGSLSTLVTPENHLDTVDKNQFAKDAVHSITTFVSFLKAAGVTDEQFAEAIENENKMES